MQPTKNIGNGIIVPLKGKLELWTEQHDNIIGALYIRLRCVGVGSKVEIDASRLDGGGGAPARSQWGPTTFLPIGRGPHTTYIKRRDVII